MDFSKPELLNLFFVLLVVSLVFYIYYVWQKNIVEKKFNKQTFRQINSNYSSSLKIIHFFLRIVVLVFLIIALAGPRVGSKLITVKREGVDVVFAIDVSKSMLVSDIEPNRLLNSLQIVSKSIDRLVSDRIGIIVYAGEAIPLMPLSFDYSMAKLLVKTIDTDIVKMQGTDIASVISESNKFFNNEERSKIIFIISDGEDHEANYETEIQSLSQKKTIISTINIGTTSGGPIPIKSGNSVNYKKDKNNQVVISRSNSKVLSAIASSFNGSFIKTSDINDAVDFIFNNMQGLDKNFEEEEVYSDYEQQFQWFLAFGLLFILIDLILTQKKINFINQIIRK